MRRHPNDLRLGQEYHSRSGGARGLRRRDAETSSSCKHRILADEAVKLLAW